MKALGNDKFVVDKWDIQFGWITSWFIGFMMGTGAVVIMAAWAGRY